MSEETDPYELRDAWKSDYYIVKDPPIAYGYVFEGCLAYDGDDFCTGFTSAEHRALFDKVHTDVPRWIAEAYGDGDICPEEVDWKGDKAVKWPLPPRTCTPAKPCWGSTHCRVGKGQRRSEEIHELVRSLAQPPLQTQNNETKGE